MKRNLIGGLLALLSAFGLVVSTAPGAHADWDTASEHYWTTKVESVRVWEKGDALELCDTSYSGTIIDMAVYFYSHQHQKWVWRYRLHPSPTKKGDCFLKMAQYGGSYNLPEDRRIKVIMRGSNGGVATHYFFNDH